MGCWKEGTDLSGGGGGPWYKGMLRGRQKSCVDITTGKH